MRMCTYMFKRVCVMMYICVCLCFDCVYMRMCICLPTCVCVSTPPRRRRRRQPCGPAPRVSAPGSTPCSATFTPPSGCRRPRWNTSGDLHV